MDIMKAKLWCHENAGKIMYSRSTDTYIMENEWGTWYRKDQVFNRDTNPNFESLIFGKGMHIVALTCISRYPYDDFEPLPDPLIPYNSDDKAVYIKLHNIKNHFTRPRGGYAVVTIDGQTNDVFSVVVTHGYNNDRVRTTVLTIDRRTLETKVVKGD